MRDASIAIMREIGVDTGGSNVQFADQPARRPHGRHRDEPARVALARRWPRRPPGSRSPRSPPSSPSATRSTRCATTSPRRTPACFEPTIDYVVTKIPRFAFEKFPQADAHPGHADEIGGRGDGHRPDLQGVAARRRCAALEIGRRRLRTDEDPSTDETIEDELGEPARPSGSGTWRDAFAQRRSASRRCTSSRSIDPWFLAQIEEIVELEHELEKRTLGDLDRRDAAARQAQGLLRPADRLAAATTDARTRCARCATSSASRPVYERVDTCAAEFAASTPYLYSTYEDE